MDIAIVGGGTAGWLSALFISKISPEHKIILIESSSVGIIGAGEGSTGSLTDVISNRIFDFGCNEIDFFRETGATLKFGIMHKNWSKKIDQYFSPLDGSPTSGSPIDYAFIFAAKNFKEHPYLITDLGKLMHYSYSNFSKSKFQFVRNNSIGNALHFDAHKVGKYFKKIAMATDKITCIDDRIVDVNITEHGSISTLLLDSGNKISADFFIDASGFSKTLTSKLGIKWMTYNKNLPVNAAMPFVLDYRPGEIPEPYTTAWAQGSGWMWRIPQQDKIGCGYVFCDDFITADKAQEEIEKKINRKINPIKILKFDTGRLENPWNKNCLSVGLSAAFAEPLEATSIHSTIVQLYTFVYEFLKPTIEHTLNESSINLYNKRINRLYDDYKNFLVMHYMGGRDDTEFWKFISSGETRTEMIDDILGTCDSRIPSKNDIPDYFGSAGWGLWSFILLGLNIINERVLSSELNLLDSKGTKLEDLGKTVLDYQNQSFDTVKKELMSLNSFIEFTRGKA
jgi:flavin-dependent dehydrogenase